MQALVQLKFELTYFCRKFPCRFERQTSDSQLPEMKYQQLHDLISCVMRNELVLPEAPLLKEITELIH